MSCEIQATLRCDECDASVDVKIKYRGSRHLHNGKELRMQTPDGWYVDETYTGEVNSLCPVHAPKSQAASSYQAHTSPSSSDARPVCYPRDNGKPSEGDTSNSTAARRGDSRFYTIGGQLIPPPRGR